MPDLAAHAPAPVFWEPNRQLTLQSARKRSERISRLRLVFVALASASFSAFFGFMTLHAALGGFGGRDEVSEAESLKMLNPRFTGRIQGGAMFDVTAATATRRGFNSDLIDLAQPVYTAKDRRVIAETGLYNQTKRTVELSGNVVFTDVSGNRFYSTHAFIDADKNRVVGQRAIRGEGPLGSVRADSYELSDGGGRVIFKGRVKGVVKQGRGST